MGDVLHLVQRRRRELSKGLNLRLAAHTRGTPGNGDYAPPGIRDRKAYEERGDPIHILTTPSFDDEPPTLEQPRADSRAARTADASGESAGVRGPAVKLCDSACDGECELGSGAEPRVLRDRVPDQDSDAATNALRFDVPAREFRCAIRFGPLRLYAVGPLDLERERWIEDSRSDAAEPAAE
jgi:hypothetical protein